MDLMILTYVKFSIICLGIIIGFIRNSVLTETNRIFWLSLFVALAGEVMDPLLAIYYRNNFVVYHIFRPLNYTILTIALANEIVRFKTLYLTTIPLVILAAILNAIYLQAPNQVLNTIIINLTSVLMILQVLFYIAVIFEKNNWDATIYYHSFWIAMAILIYSIASFLSLGIHNFLDAAGQAIVVQVQAYSEFVLFGGFVLNFMLQKNVPAILKQDERA